MTDFPFNKSPAAAGAILFIANLGARPAPSVRNIEDYLGSQFSPSQLSIPSAPSRRAFTSEASNVIAHWNQIAIDASGLDHTPVAVGDSRIFGEQLGPTRASRAIAIVHIAIFDSVNGVIGGYNSYTNIAPARNASINAAVAQAAHNTLVALFPSQQA